MNKPRATLTSPWDVLDRDGSPMNLRIWQEIDPVTGEEIVHCTFSLRPYGQPGLYENMEDDGVTVKSVIIASTSGARLAEGIGDGTLRLNVLAFRKPHKATGKASGGRRSLIDPNAPVGPSRPAGPPRNVTVPQGKR